MIIGKGIMAVATIKINNFFFPLKSYFANAYPANVHKKTVNIVTAIATIKELYIQRLAGNSVNKLVTFSQLGLLDQIIGGHAIISAVDFTEDVSMKA